MSIISALQQGWQRSWQYKRIVLLLYILTFGFAAFLAYPLQTYLESKVGHSLMVGEMVKGFDYTFINDFMNAYGDGISPIVNQSLLSLILYALLLIFLQGGILSIFLSYAKPYESKLFWSQSAAYFWRMFRMSVYFWILHIIVLIVFVMVFLAFTKGLSPNNLSSDTIITSTIKYLTPVYILFLAFFLMWQDYAKVQLVKSDAKWMFQPILTSIRFSMRNLGKTYGLYLLNLSLLGLLIFINNLLSTAFEIDSTTTIMLSFLLSQIFVIGRLWLRLVNQGSVVAMVEASGIRFQGSE